MQRKSTKFIVVHHAATKKGQDVGVKEIRRWHLDRGFTDVGYHYIIRRDGRLETGRAIGVAGAHVSGRNHNSIGICLVGGLSDDGKKAEFNYTEAQLATLEKTLRSATAAYPAAEVVGHRDLDPKKPECPAFDVKKWWADKQAAYFAGND
jgi:N-acetyl-anhydromuramyl-L-alanine amidase AmpD